MQKSLTRLFTAVLMAALLISASIMSVSAATSTCPECDHTSHEGWIAIDPTVTDSPNYTVTKSGDTVTHIRLFTDGGKYYLPADVHVKTQFEIGGSASSNNGSSTNKPNITLCLNGHNLTSNGTNIRVGNYCTLNLVNCVEDDAAEAASGKFTKGLVTGVNYSLLVTANGTANMGPNVHVNDRAKGAFAVATAYGAGSTINMYGGTISNNIKDNTKSGTGYDGIVETVSGAVFNMYAGEISGNTVSGNGTVNNKGIFNMYGGKISGNSAYNGGAILNNSESAVLNISGSSILDGNHATAANNGGGAICLFSTSKATIDGATITNNTSKKNSEGDGGNGGGIHMGASAILVINDVTMSGNTAEGSGNGLCKVSGSGTLTINGGKFKDSLSLNSTTTITGGKFGTEPAASYIVPGYAAKAIDEDPYFFEVVENLSDCPDHSAGWTQITDASNARITKAGYYVVTADLTAGATGATVGCITVDAPKNAKVVICLNGHNLTPASGVGAGLYVRSGKVTLHNCSNTVSTISAGDSRAVCVGNNSGDVVGEVDRIDVLTINGKNIVIDGAKKSKPCINVFREGHLIMNDGTITNSSNYRGVYVQGGIFEMNGGTITGNTSSKGAAVRVEKASIDEDTLGSFIMNGGTISNNSATEEGGAIYLLEGNTFTMTGGTITGNSAYNGGAILSQAGILNISGGTFSGNSTLDGSNNGGGAICLFSTSQLTLTGGTFTNNTTSANGGAILVGSNATAAISGITTSGNTNKNGESNSINQFSGGAGSVTITSGNFGDGIYLGGTAAISGGKFATDVSAKVVAGMGLKPIDEAPYKYEVVNADELFSDCTNNPGVHTGWTVINESSAYISGAGYYVLGADLTDNSQAAITAGAAADSTTGALVINAGSGTTVTLCLNGHSINATNANKAIRIRSGNLILCNCIAASDENPNSGKITCSKANHVIQLGINGGTRGTASLTIGDNIHIDGSQTTSGNGIIHVGNDGIFTMNGGTINNNTSADKVVWLQSGQFIMNGGEISGNTTTSESAQGTVQLANNGDKYAPEFILNDGVIQNNTVGHRGGAVYISAIKDAQIPGTFTMNGGTIANNTATDAGWDVYAMAGTFTMTGGSISNNSEDGNQIVIASNATGVFSDAAQIDISEMAAYGNVTISAEGMTSSSMDVKAPAGKEANVTTISAGTYDKVWNGGVGTLTITNGKFGSVTGSGKTTVSGGLFAEKVDSSKLPSGKAMVASGDTDYPWTVGDAPAIGECPDHTGWIEINGASNACITKAGHYVLTADLTAKSAAPYSDACLAIEIWSGNKEVVLCLNGHSITPDGAAHAIYVNSGELTLCNCSATTSVISNGSNRAVCVGNNSNDNDGKDGRIDLLTVDSDNITFTANGAGNTVFQVFREGKLTLNGGTVTGTTGRAVNIQGGEVVLDGATITGNMYGVNIEKDSTNKGIMGSFVMESGYITNNTAIYGTAVWVNGTGDDANTFIMNGGEISGNTVNGTGNGGSVLLYAKGSFTMNGGSIINNKQAEGCTIASGVQVGTNASMTMTGGLIGNNDGVDLRAGKTMIMTGGTIDGRYHNADNTTGSISGGKFGKESDMSHVRALLATDKGMLSLVDIDGGQTFEVRRGFANVGEHMDFKSSLGFSLYLNADANFTSEGYEDFTYTAISGNKEYDVTASLVETNLMVTASGVAAKEMQDAITFTVKDGETVLFSETLSVYDAAQEWAKEANKATLVADMINYGAAAQAAFGYGQGKTMTGSKEVTEEWNTADAFVTPGYEDKIAVSLNLKERIELNIYVNSADVVVAESDDYAVTKVNDGAITRITFDKINVKDVKTQITLNLTVDGAPVTITYSVEAYVAAAAELGQQDLMTALQKYVDSVCAYTGN